MLSALRLPKIVFPSSWPETRTNQKQIIRLLLQHNPTVRPSAADLARNELLPKRMEEESINEALRLLGESNVPLIRLCPVHLIFDWFGQ